MDSSFRRALVACLLLLAVVADSDARRRRPFIPGKTEPVPTPVSQPTQDTRATSVDMVDMERRMANVEQSTSIIKREMLEAKTENNRLKEEIQSMSGLVRDLELALARVDELQWILTKFENFFGVLYTNMPDVFAEEMTVNARLSRLREYIGNREAELMALRPNPPVVKADPAESPVDEELLGVAMDQLSSDNAKLRRRLDSMEGRMVAIPGDSSSNNTSGPVVTATAPDPETEERLTRLERLLALQLAPQLDEEDIDQTAITLDSGGKRIAPGGVTTERLALSESDTEILREELNTVRSIASTRKSVFSAATTRHIYGEVGGTGPVFFDHVFTNKGNHLQEHNSTFVCSITGFYFITFTARSYDNLYLGVNLVMNGERVVSVMGESDPKRNQMMSQSIVLHLRPGDKLWLTITPSISFGIYSDQAKYCTFSGFLLFKGS